MSKWGSLMEFQVTQQQFSAHLRNPDRNPAPADIEDRRMKIYRELIYNNIEGFLSGGFPILRQILSDDHWHSIVRDFIDRHQSHSPYFLEISQEFLGYLQQERAQVPNSEQDPPFMLELAHYEWVELALDVAEEEYPQDVTRELDPLEHRPVVSPLAWCLSYQYPVHRIGPEFQPQTASEPPTCLVVYRNRGDEVAFMEANAVTFRLLELLRDDEAPSGRVALEQIAAELQAPDPGSIIENGLALLQQLLGLGIICGVRENEPE